MWPPRTPDFWSMGAGDVLPRLLAPAAWAWEVGSRGRRAVTRARKLRARTIVVGNLVAGGAGKTPTAIALARFFSAAGLAPQIVASGYRAQTRDPVMVAPDRQSAALIGDEALLLA